MRYFSITYASIFILMLSSLTQIHAMDVPEMDLPAVPMEQNQNIDMLFTQLSLGPTMEYSQEDAQKYDQEYAQAKEDVDNLQDNQAREKFDMRKEESVYKMAFRFLYAKKNLENIDRVNCLGFLNNCEKYGVNTAKSLTAPQKHPLLSEKYFKYLLPILEKVLDICVTSLYVDATDLIVLPKELCFLTRLSSLDWSRHKGGGLFGGIDDASFAAFCLDVKSDVQPVKSNEPIFPELPLWLLKMQCLNEIIVSPECTVPSEFYDSVITVYSGKSKFDANRFYVKYGT